ncbi:hypothetical protein PLICRDRAFT_629129 [Plicaturopsis crispa FD-325 SS-3]|nr:hypothetical protein PLICRDRAFT_629129 [Plicaturopsis crispa FD-325 SS-3]
MFNLSMQTGAFVQLLLTLIAICSRTSMLLTEIEESMELSREVCCSLLLVLDPANTNKPGSAATKPISIEDNESHSNTTWAAEPNDLDTVYEDEDVGKAVSRARGRSSSPHPQTLLPPTLPENTTRSDDDEMIIGDTDARMTLPTIVKQIPLAMASHASVAPASGNFGKKRGTTGEEKAKKKKKKKNEIDDIFGF